MSGVPFLLEIGTEEIPDWMIPGALENLRELCANIPGLPLTDVALDATPRRLVLRAQNVPERQPDSEELVKGPAKSAPAGAVATITIVPNARTAASSAAGRKRGFTWSPR